MGIVRVTMTSQMWGQRFQNVLHFDNPDGMLTELQIVQDLEAHWIPQVRFIQNVNHAYTQITVQKLLPQKGIPYIKDISDAFGILTGEGAPGPLCILFSLRTSKPGRKGRGRIYLGGVHLASIQAGKVHNNALIAYAEVALNLTERYKEFSNVGPLRLGILPRSATSETQFTAMQTLIARGVFGIQRRRNIGVGV